MCWLVANIFSSPFFWEVTDFSFWTVFVFSSIVLFYIIWYFGLRAIWFRWAFCQTWNFLYNIRLCLIRRTACSSIFRFLWTKYLARGGNAKDVCLRNISSFKLDIMCVTIKVSDLTEYIRNNCWIQKRHNLFILGLYSYCMLV